MKRTLHYEQFLATSAQRCYRFAQELRLHLEHSPRVVVAQKDLANYTSTSKKHTLCRALDHFLPNI